MIMMKVNVWSSRSELQNFLILKGGVCPAVEWLLHLKLMILHALDVLRFVIVMKLGLFEIIVIFLRELNPGFVFFYRAFFLSHYPFKYFMSSSFNCTCNKHLLLIRLFYFILLQAYVRFHPYFVMYTFLLMLVDFISLSKINGSILLRLAWDVIYKKQFR